MSSFPTGGLKPARRPSRALAVAGLLLVALLVPLLMHAAPPAVARTTAWRLPAHAKLYVLGDSWASGYRADPKHTLVQVAAADLHWRVRVDAIAGTGYTNNDGTPGADYITRSRVKIPGYQPDVILLQGTGNDYYAKPATLRANTQIVIRNMHHNYPKAHIVLLGPGDDQQPYLGLYKQIDTNLAAVAKSDRLPYISMYKGNWITKGNFTKVIDLETGHPSLAGHHYLGHKLATALKQVAKG
jgi:lysophospholipase L1-like esterase